MSSKGEDIAIGVTDHCANERVCRPIIARFIRHFDEALRYHPIDKKDQFKTCGIHGFTQKVHRYVCTNRPIELVVPAFPCKSPNAVNKVLGILPDRTEEWALSKLERFCADVELYYPHGCILTIVSDGRVFADLVGVPDQYVTDYNHFLENLLFEKDTLAHIRFRSLDDHLAGKSGTSYGSEIGDDEASPHDQRRAGLLQSFIDNPNEYRGSDMVKLGFVRYLIEDRTWPADMSKSKIKRVCRSIAERMIERNVAFSGLVERCYSDHVRLSIHPYDSSGPKYPIQIAPNVGGPTPWHSAAVELKSGKLVFVRRKVADELVEQGHLRLYEHPIHKRPWCYQQISSIELDIGRQY